MFCISFHINTVLKRPSPRVTSDPTDKDVNQWTSEDVYAWVNSLGENYSGVAESWRKNGVFGELLVTFSDEDLQTYGVNEKLMRAVMLRKLAGLKQRAEENV